MARPMSDTDRRKPATIVLGPRAARLLGGYALAAMHAWFVIKLTLPSEAGAMELVAGIAALTGLLACVTFFVCTYGVLANSPDDMLETWQVGERNRAYFDAFKYILALLLAASLGSDFLAKLFDFELSVPVMQNYLVLVIATALILPAYLLAWRDRRPARD